MYESTSVNVSELAPYYIKVIYTDKNDAHAISTKLKVTNLYPDTNTAQAVEEATITITEPLPTTTTVTTTTVAPTTTTTTPGP